MPWDIPTVTSFLFEPIDIEIYKQSQNNLYPQQHTGKPKRRTDSTNRRTAFKCVQAIAVSEKAVVIHSK